MKERLQHVLQLNDNERFQFIANNGEAFFGEMLEVIGSIDHELRDQLNYRAFIELLSANLIPQSILAKLTLTLSAKDYLYKGDMHESDDVFTRSFSALWLTALINADQQLAFLNKQQMQGVMEQAIYYLEKEKDARGFVEGKGWAHSIAHGADLSKAIIDHRHSEIKYYATILQGIKAALWKGRVFTDDEEERLCTVIEAIVKNDFPEEVLNEWIEQLFEKLQYTLYTEGYTKAFFIARTNTLHFAKTLYFTLKFINKYDTLRATTSIFISKWMKLQ